MISNLIAALVAVFLVALVGCGLLVFIMVLAMGGGL